jgi:hypothetical protein
MTTTKIPYDFLRQRVSLSWPEIKYGVDHQLIAPKVAIDKATDRLCSSANVSGDEIELAGRSESDSILELVSRLANSENTSTEESIRAKWLYLALAWLFENRESVNNPLGIVEDVYSDFDYPREVAAFVRSMPMVGPDLGNREQNEARLYEYWKSYLDDAGKRFAPST